jgi:sodium/proline symporter
MITALPTLLTFLFYILAMIFIGWFGYRATSDLSDYILGGRRLGRVVTALSAGASDMSGWLLMGLPGSIYLVGISSMWIAIGLVLGAWFNWRFVAARLRLYTEQCGNALTLPDYLTNRFENTNNALRIISALAILTFFTIYCASGVVAGARLFESLFGFSYFTSLWLGAFATITYVFFGGFLAISWTDTIQASLMIMALAVTPFIIIYYNGGLTPSIHAIQLANPLHTSLFGSLTTIEIISLLAWGLGYFGQPHILVRFMAASSIHVIPSARRISMTWMILCLIGAVAVGFFAKAYFLVHPEQAAAVNFNTERVFIEIVKQLLNPWVTGVLLAAILAAIMSTLSCQLLMCSSALTEDIYRTFFRKKASERELIWCGRTMVLLVSLIAIGLASNPNSQILSMVSYAWAGFGAAFGPVIILSLFWSRMTSSGALAGILVGSVTVIIWKQFAWFQLYEIVPGFIFALLAIIVVSQLSTIPSASVNNVFNSVKKVFSPMNKKFADTFMQ